MKKIIKLILALILIYIILISSVADINQGKGQAGSSGGLGWKVGII